MAKPRLQLQQLFARLDVGPAEVEAAKHAVGQRSLQWLLLRQYRLTASNFAAAAGTDRFRPPVAVMTDMLSTSARQDLRGSMRYGQLLEQHALKVYAASRPRMHLSQIGLAIAPEAPWLACSPDAMVRDDFDGSVGLLEVKCPTSRLNLTPWGCPDYMAQIQGSMGLLRLAWCDFAVWTRAKGLVVYRVPFDLEYYGKLWKQLNVFYFDRFVPFALSASQHHQPTSYAHSSSGKLSLHAWLRLLAHLVAAVPAVMREWLACGSFRRSCIGRCQQNEELRDQVRHVWRLPGKSPSGGDRISARIAISVLFRPEPVLFVAGRTYPYREALRCQFGLRYCPIWRGWRSQPLTSVAAADEVAAQLQQHLESEANRDLARAKNHTI